MQTIDIILETRKAAILAEYPNRHALTTAVFEEISAMLHEDFDEISRESKRWRLVFDCVADVLTKLRMQDVKKKYATDLLDVLLDKHVTAYMESALGDKNRDYSAAINGARSALCSSQWNDATSKHWERAIARFRM